MENTKYESKLKSGLVLWASAHEVKPVDFADKMGYAYATAWDLLRGKRPYTPEAFGRFALAYGTEAAKELMELAELPDGIDVEGISTEGSLIVPLVTVASDAKQKLKYKKHLTSPAKKAKRAVIS